MNSINSDETPSNMECGGLCGAVFLELSTASDTVDRRILYHSTNSKLWLCHGTVGWFESYLSNRIKKSFCKSELSDALPVTFAVPYESILCPLLFLVYIKELPSKPINTIFRSEDTVLYCYASEVYNKEILIMIY